MKGYVIWADGDDYHGSFIASGIFLDENKAQEKADTMNEEQPNKCDTEGCDHKHSYTVWDLEFEEPIPYSLDEVGLDSK